MSRKHFVAIAAAILESRETSDKETVDTMSRTIADVCASANPHFDRSRFLRACGV